MNLLLLSIVLAVIAVWTSIYFLRAREASARDAGTQTAAPGQRAIFEAAGSPFLGHAIFSEADWDFIHSVNLKEVFFCCQNGARLMRKTGGGRIVNISSLGGLRPWAEHAHYCASKAGVIMLTRALSKAFAPQITVNSVAPGVIPFGDEDERTGRLICATPAGRAGTADEIADAVVFLASGMARAITGQCLDVNCGEYHH